MLRLIGVALWLLVTITTGIATGFRPPPPAISSTEDLCDRLAASLDSYLSTNASTSPFDVCYWNRTDARPGYGTFGCEWQVARLRDHDYPTDCRLSGGIVSYSPDQGEYVQRTIVPFGLSFRRHDSASAATTEAVASLDKSRIDTSERYDEVEGGTVRRIWSDTCEGVSVILTVPLASPTASRSDDSILVATENRFAHAASEFIETTLQSCQDRLDLAGST